MACTKAELISGINSYFSARLSQDAALQDFATQRLEKLIETLEFAEEAEEKEESTSEVN